MNMNDIECIKYIEKRLEELDNKEIYNLDEEITNKIKNNVYKMQENVNLIYKKYLSELDNLIGLEEVKLEVKKLINYLIFLKRTKNKIKIDNINLNMIFRGNPGTGKTTVARIIAKILCGIGILKSNKVFETTPRDFIAGYVGQTALKAKELIDKAQGGVIFIDEAYTFAQSTDENGHTFVYEAITEIIKEMENKNTVFIFSGYEKEMSDFIDINPGIKSRIGYDITFKNYTKEELLTMFYKKVANAGMNISNDAKEILSNKIEMKMQNRNFGNGRMIDNLFNEILREHASRNLYEFKEEKLLLITKESIENIKIKSEGGMYFG